MVNWQKNPDLKDRISRRMIQWIFGVLLFVSGTKVKAECLENIPKDRAVLYVGNHRSYFDIITSYRLLPGITGYVAKKEMAKVPLLRLWMRYIHCLFLDRSNVKEGLKQSSLVSMSLKTVILYGSSQKALETVVKKAVCLNLRKAA